MIFEGFLEFKLIFEPLKLGPFSCPQSAAILFRHRVNTTGSPQVYAANLKTRPTEKNNNPEIITWAFLRKPK